MERPTPRASNLTLSIDSWRFLNGDESPILRHSSEARTWQPRPLLHDTPVDLLRLKRLLADEISKREQIMVKLTALEESAHMFSDATEALDNAIHELQQTKSVLAKVGEMALDHGHLREHVVGLCSSVGVPVGPCIHITGWTSLPRMRVYEEETSLIVTVCSSDGVPRGSTIALPWCSETIAAALPIGGLPGNSTTAIFRICCADGETVAETQPVLVERLFSLAQEMKLPLIRGGVELQDAELRLRGLVDLEIS